KGAEGGVLIQLGIHAVDNLLYLLGPVTAVTSMMRPDQNHKTLPSVVTLQLEHSSGALSTMMCSWIVPAHYRVDLIADGGNLHFEQQSHRLRFGVVDRYGRFSPEGKGGVAIEAPELVVGDRLAEQMDELASVVRTRTPVEVG